MMYNKVYHNKFDTPPVELYDEDREEAKKFYLPFKLLNLVF